MLKSNKQVVIIQEFQDISCSIGIRFIQIQTLLKRPSHKPKDFWIKLFTYFTIKSFVQRTKYALVSHRELLFS